MNKIHNINLPIQIAKKILREKIVSNKNIPICSNCMFFFKKYDNYNEVIYEKSKCMKFAIKNILSGEIENEIAINCRCNEEKCGHKGKNFIKK